MSSHIDEATLIEEMRIPDRYLLIDPVLEDNSGKRPAFPVLVFINSRSGGQLGVQLLTTYRGLLNPLQVFDLDEQPPDKVLHRILGHLEKLKAEGDYVAEEIRKSLRIIVAGGDGTAGWLLGVISDLKLSDPPPVATVPLGTGNNLPFSFGWGKKNPSTDREAVKSFLQKVKDARVMKVDSWHLRMRMRIPTEGPLDPVPPPLELPHALHAFKRIESGSQTQEGYHTFRGGFWNYFSLGMDAQVSYAFHSERKQHPERFKNQLKNQGTYARIGWSQGWFCASLVHPASRNIPQLANVKVAKLNGDLEELPIPNSIRSIVCLNLPSFSGGLNPWGMPNDKKSKQRGLTPPFVDDGLIEVVGFRDGWHGLALLAPNGHGTRLAQAHRVVFEFHQGAADHNTYMRMDGEPWKQPLPKNDDTVIVEISHLGQVSMLATENCISKSIRDQNAYPYEETNGDDETNDDSDADPEESESRRKFGAATTFKIDIDHID